MSEATETQAQAISRLRGQLLVCAHLLIRCAEVVETCDDENDDERRMPRDLADAAKAAACEIWRQKAAASQNTIASERPL